MPRTRPPSLPSFPRARAACAAVLALLLAACTTTRPATADAPAAAGVRPESRQLIVVTSAGWDATQGTLRAFERGGGGAWRPVGGPQAVSLGRSGSAWGTGLHPAQAEGPQKVEGDGRSPAGMFAVEDAFGYAASVPTGLHYRAMDAGDYCIDVDASPLYNRIVNTRDVGEQAVAGSTEPMRRDLHADGDVRYKAGFVIAHNPGHVPRGGSCIFAHLWRTPGEPTAGCTAMPEPAMQALLAWLDRRQRPVFALLPEAEYARVRDAWGLPQLDGTGLDGTEAAR